MDGGAHSAKEPVEARVLVVEKDKRIATEVAAILEKVRFKVECVENGRDGLLRALTDRFEAIVLGRTQFPDLDALAIISALRAVGINPLIALLTLETPVRRCAHCDDENVAADRNGGVKSTELSAHLCQSLLLGLVTRHDGVGALAEMWPMHASSTVVVSEPSRHQLADSALLAMISEGGDSLSRREVEILQRLSRGSSTLAVGQQLFLSPNTVRWYLRRIYAKLGVNSKTRAIYIARQRGLLS